MQCVTTKLTSAWSSLWELTEPLVAPPAPPWGGKCTQQGEEGKNGEFPAARLTRPLDMDAFSVHFLGVFLLAREEQAALYVPFPSLLPLLHSTPQKQNFFRSEDGVAG